MIPSLAAEVARESQEVKEAFTRNVTPMLARIAEQMDDTEPQARQTRALAQLAQMVGGLLLARAVNDTELSDRILQACRTSLLPNENPE
ncbi:hypothetical protein D3C72_2133650 [compost metagenome]